MPVSLELVRLIENMMTDYACFILTKFILDYPCLGCPRGA